MFKLKSDFQPISEQIDAIEKLAKGIFNSEKNQTLLGVTGSGKTFTVANLIKKTSKPTLIISHNKTLAGQLYQEMKDFFPENAVSYFVSYYDYYQPEAYIPQTDTYIEKEAQINDLIDKLRLKAIIDILTRKDVIIVASVSSIYNIGSSKDFQKFLIEIKINEKINSISLFKKLAELQYSRSEFDFKRGTFRVRGNYIDIYPAYEDFAYRINLENDIVESITKIDPISGTIKEKNNNFLFIYPAKQYIADKDSFLIGEKEIRKDLEKEYKELISKKKEFEANRLLKKVNYDLEMINELGYVNGIENYSRYFDGRKPKEAPFSLLDYFNDKFGNDWLTIIDESHMTVPQIRGMFNGDQSRKKTLIDYGFRLKAALDNRPLNFDEFYKKTKSIVYVSATPDEWELKQSSQIVEQLVRPTGVIDPKITIKKSENEIQDLILEIEKRIKLKQRVLVTTLTKKTAEDLSSFLKEKNIKAEYLHSDVKTLERSSILNKLRKQEYDVLIGINLLREGLDLPEVTLVAILDADHEGFLRSRTALIQTMGRAARNINGEVIIYADKITKSIKQAVSEVERRRNYQIEFNKKNNIIPKNIVKKIRENLTDEEDVKTISKISDLNIAQYLKVTKENLTPYDKKRLIKKFEKEMKLQADNLNFELAIKIREKILELQK